MPTSTRYLATFACQGGLPLGLVGNADSSVARYLRAVLKHTATYRRFVDDPIDLAQDLQHLLRPPTLRRDYVFRLAADLIEAVLDLRNEADDEDPLTALDQAGLDWRRTMPLDLEDERARELLTGLLLEAVRDRASPVDDFRVERFLRETGIGWRIGARVRLPPSMPPEVLAKHLGVRPSDLPPRLQVHAGKERTRVVGLYGARSDEFVLVGDSRGGTEFWDSEAIVEIRLRFLAGGEIGDSVVPYRGSALGELPWVFRSGDENSFIGEGSVANRAPEFLVLVPEGCTPDRGEMVREASFHQQEEAAPNPGNRLRIADRVLWKISEEATIETGSGPCVVRPLSGQTAVEDYLLSGPRFFGFESNCPLFRGAPTLRSAKAEEPSRAVPANEVGWRQAGGEWQRYPNGFGLWEIRHVRGGELHHFSRAGILPKQLRLVIEPGPDMSHGHLLLTDAEGVMVAGDDFETVATAESKGSGVRIRVTSKNEAAPPVHLALRLHWARASELTVRAPFPGQGGRFVRDGRSLRGSLATHDLYGVRATALAPDTTQRFWIEGELKAADAGPLRRVAYFRRLLRRSGVSHELPLVDVRPMVELLLGGSSSTDALVGLRIVDRYQRAHDSVNVSRFTARLECQPQLGLVSVSPGLGDKERRTIDALPIARPRDEAASIVIKGSGDNEVSVAALPRDLDVSEPWLLLMRQDDGVRVRPAKFGGSSWLDTSTDDGGPRVPRLAEASAVEDPELLERHLAAAMDALLENVETKRSEAEWSFLTDSLLRIEGLPANAVDLCRVLVTKPRLLVRCLFRLEKAPRQVLWNLDEVLPFSWLLVRRDIWWSEAKQSFDRFQKELAGLQSSDQISQQHLMSVLAEGAKRIPGLDTLSTDIGYRLKGDKLSRSFYENEQQKLTAQRREQIRLRASLDDWPTGDGRRSWTRELEHGDLLDRLKLWHDADEHPARQPIFDTPIAAAWCCFFSPPTHRTTFLVEHIRAHDPEWFDTAYRAVWFELARKTDEIRNQT